MQKCNHTNRTDCMIYIFPIKLERKTKIKNKHKMKCEQMLELQIKMPIYDVKKFIPFLI